MMHSAPSANVVSTSWRQIGSDHWEFYVGIFASDFNYSLDFPDSAIYIALVGDLGIPSASSILALSSTSKLLPRVSTARSIVSSSFVVPLAYFRGTPTTVDIIAYDPRSLQNARDTYRLAVALLTVIFHGPSITTSSIFKCYKWIQEGRFIVPMELTTFRAAPPDPLEVVGRGRRPFDKRQLW